MAVAIAPSRPNSSSTASGRASIIPFSPGSNPPLKPSPSGRGLRRGPATGASSTARDSQPGDMTPVSVTDWALLSGGVKLPGGRSDGNIGGAWIRSRSFVAVLLPWATKKRDTHAREPLQTPTRLADGLGLEGLPFPAQPEFTPKVGSPASLRSLASVQLFSCPRVVWAYGRQIMALRSTAKWRHSSQESKKLPTPVPYCLRRAAS